MYRTSYNDMSVKVSRIYSWIFERLMA
jgi:hypothetical protein